MKAIATATISIQKAIQLNTEILEAIRSYDPEPTENKEKGYTHYQWDTFDDMTVIKHNNSTKYVREAGHATHSLDIDLETGTLEMVHHGFRNSSHSGTFAQILPEWYWEEIALAENWQLVSLESSQPDWGLEMGLMIGQIKEGPRNLEEAVGMGLIKPTFTTMKGAIEFMRKVVPDPDYIPDVILELVSGYVDSLPAITKWNLSGYRDPWQEILANF